MKKTEPSAPLARWAPLAEYAIAAIGTVCGLKAVRSARPSLQRVSTRNTATVAGNERAAFRVDGRPPMMVVAAAGERKTQMGPWPRSPQPHQPPAPQSRRAVEGAQIEAGDRASVEGEEIARLLRLERNLVHAAGGVCEPVRVALDHRLNPRDRSTLSHVQQAELLQGVASKIGMSSVGSADSISASGHART